MGRAGGGSALSYLEHDMGSESSRTVERPVTQRTPAGSTPAPLLDLQRLAGNAAVSHAIQSGRFDSTTVQREPEGAGGSEEEEFEAEEAEANEELAEDELSDEENIEEEQEMEAETTEA